MTCPGGPGSASAPRSAMADDQRDVIEFLSKPSSYTAAVERVDIVQTHVSLVFLAGERAYKLKRAIKFPYLDFSSAEARRVACETELVLNRRTASDLYLEVRALTRTANGGVGFGTEGPMVDWVVVMDASIRPRCSTSSPVPVG